MRKIIALALALMLMASSAMAATVTTSVISPSSINPAQSFGRPATAVGVPAETRIHEFRTTTDADILQIDQVVVTVGGGGTLYQVAQAAGGSDTEPPSPLFETLVPTLTADSFISTPGATSIAGDTANPFGTQNNSWFDTTSDGAQTNFMFARFGLTGANASATFAGRVQVAGTAGPESFPFTFTLSNVDIPEPATVALGGMGLVGLLAVRRRKA
jgi:threonine dehydrogenase-like Zn-dependent dehydrogenase